MEETEKMAALKKAYAEIILNTSKEAAARIILSERRALGFQRDLSMTKDEALRLCLRIKQMMDFKMDEAEMKSLNQQRRIDELEAQLQEAEDIVSDLRAELSDAQLELEKLSKNQQRSFNEQNCAVETAYKEGTEQYVQGEMIDLSSTAMTSLALQPKALSSLEANYSTFNPRSCEVKNISNNCYEEYNYASKPDVASIVMRSTEPELYKNGCTQRIRACEMNFLNGHLSLSGKPDDPRGRKNIQEEKGGEEIVLASGEETANMVEKKLVAVKEVINDANASRKGLQFESFYKKRRARNKLWQKSVPVEAMGSLKEPLEVSHSSAHPVPSNHFSNVIDQEDKNNLETALDQRAISSTKHLNSSEVATGEVIKTSVATSVNDMELVDALILIRQESGSKNDKGVVSSEAEVEIPAVSLANSKARACTVSEGIHVESPNKDRIVKYTFQRKRKRESISSNENNYSSQGENVSKVKAGNEQNANGVNNGSQSSVATESSRDSRRIAQVAHQLISLSEKKRWQ